MNSDIVEYVDPADRRKWVAKNIGTKACDFNPDILQKLADSPLMDANKIYLPAGLISIKSADKRSKYLIEQE